MLFGKLGRVVLPVHRSGLGGVARVELALLPGVDSQWSHVALLVEGALPRELGLVLVLRRRRDILSLVRRHLLPTREASLMVLFALLTR